LSKESINWYRPKLQRFAEVCPKLPKNPRPIEAFLANLDCSPTQKLNYFNALRAFYRFISKRYHKPNPIEQIEAPRCPKKVMASLEPEQEMRLLNSASNLRDRAMLTLFVDSGIRSSELAGLRRQDIEAEILRVHGKSGERQVPISEETRRILLSVIAQNGKGDYVFYGHKGILTRHGIYRIVSAYMKKADIQGAKLGPHRIRHAFGKGYLVNGGDIRSLQDILGHANITTTQKYATLSLRDTISKHHRFTPLRAAHAAAQESLFDTAQAIKEAEAIVMDSPSLKNSQSYEG